MVEATFEEALDLVKVTPKQKQRLITVNDQLVRDAGRRVRAASTAAAAKVSSSMLAVGGLSLVGGAGAEIVRRNLVGRVVKDAKAQGAGLMVIGAAALWGGKKVPLLKEIGAAHIAVGAAVLTSALHGSDEKPDPVKYALEATTYKAKHPAKAEKKAESKE